MVELSRVKGLQRRVREIFRWWFKKDAHGAKASFSGKHRLLYDHCARSKHPFIRDLAATRAVGLLQQLRVHMPGSQAPQKSWRQRGGACVRSSPHAAYAPHTRDCAR